MAADEAMAARLRLGVRLRGLRETAGIRGADAAVRLAGTHSKISRMEGGRVQPRPGDVSVLLDMYGADDDARVELLGLVEEASKRGWWDAPWDLLTAGVRADLAREAAADLLVCYDPVAVPALLQTPGYSAALCAAIPPERPWRAGLDVRTLTRRRQILTAAKPPKVWALVAAAVLHRSPGGDGQILRRQLQHLIRLAAGPQVVVQIVPDDASAHLAAPGPFTVLRYNAPDLADDVIQESITGTFRSGDAAYYMELIASIGAQAHTPAESVTMITGMCR